MSTVTTRRHREQAALLSTRLAIARWSHPAPAAAQPLLDTKAQWHARVANELYAWMLNGGFSQQTKALRQNENDGIAPSSPRPAWDTL